ncbi:MAG: DUF4843 domain-containing protein [Cyclobacteriaceae bacterium]|nr:DUF4843 domain-containing protein [Cyclobacteriaceae bacterium]
MKLVMKKLKIFVYVLPFVFLISCIENEKTLWGDSLVEFDATVLNAPALGKDFPLLTRVPLYGRPVVTTGASANPVITRASGTISFRVNFVSPQRSSAETIGLVVVDAETTAIEGVHYTISNTITIAANSSYADYVVNVIDPGVPSATPVDLVVELTGNETIDPSPNYKRLGIRISQN